MLYDDKFMERVRKGLLHILKSVIPSKTLANAVTVRSRLKPRPGLAMNIPHYWAKYYHDGSGPVSMPKGQYMVWFRDPKDDPRLKGGHPVKKSDVRSLNISRSHFTSLVREGKLVVRASVGRRKGTPFIPRAQKKWTPWIKTQVNAEIERKLLKSLKEFMKLKR